MSAEAIILAVGTELVTGQTLDTNSKAIATALIGQGLRVRAFHVIGDSREEIAGEIKRAAGMAEVVIVTGGLGPTADDLTRAALADAMGVELAEDAASLQAIEAFFERRGWPMNPTNRCQAQLPVGATMIPNPVGTAPGIDACVGDARVFVLPGVPREMHRMLAEHVLPATGPMGGGQAVVIRRVHAFGAGESDIGARLEDLMARDANPLVGTTASGGQIGVRIIATAEGRDLAETMAAESVAEVRRRLGDLAFGVDDDTLAGVVGRLLIERSATLAGAESCTGGLVGQLITAEAGASEYFLGSIVCYANEIKQAILGVSEALLVEHGAVSEPVACAMAEAAADRLGADYAFAITGIAGPTGGSEDKPVGTVFVALAGPQETEVLRRVYPGDRDMVRLRSALTALNMLRLRLLENAP